MRLTLLITSFLSAAQATLAAPKPNILMLVVDDWGWANNIWHRSAGQPGNEEFPTPNLAALAAEGLLFDRMYAHKVSPPALPLPAGSAAALLAPTPLSHAHLPPSPWRLSLVDKSLA